MSILVYCLILCPKLKLKTEHVTVTFKLFNSLPNDKILDWSKLKAFADDKIKVTEHLKFVL